MMKKKKIEKEKDGLEERGIGGMKRGFKGKKVEVGVVRE